MAPPGSAGLQPGSGTATLERGAPGDGWRASRALLQFLLAGGLLFLADRWLAGGRTPPPARIVVSAAEVAALRQEAVARTGHVPDQAELHELVAAAVDDEILYREAVALDLAREDSIVRRRLLQNLRFLGGAEDAIDAPALGSADPVVRRRLVQQMRLRLESERRESEPAETALRQYFAAYPERFALPERVRLSQVFLSAARRGAGVDDDATALLAELQTGLDPQRGAARGDAALFPAHLPLQSAAELAKLFGPALAQAAITAPVGAWSGPLTSPYGRHLIWVHERRAPEPPPFDTVRAAVRLALEEERAATALRSALAQLRPQYEVVVEGAR